MNPVSLKRNVLSKELEPIAQADAWVREAGKTKNANASEPSTFEKALVSELGRVFSAQSEVDAAVSAYNAGAPEASVERTAFLMAKAEADLRLAVQVRNKAVNAYQEVMNMQI